jgi:hypothetical protein
MKLLNSLLPILLIVVLSSLLMSCTPAPCYEETNSFLKASFYSDKGVDPPDSISLWGIGQTTKIYNKATGVQPALFPLNSGTDNSTFIIRINGVYDTIEFRYTSFPHIISKECGYTFFHTLDSHIFTQNNIDNILIINQNITTVNEENIRIFY